MLPSKRPVRKQNKNILSFCALVALSSVGACATMPPPSSHMPVGSMTAAPSGLVSLCKTTPEICRTDAKETKLLASIEQDPSGVTGAIKDLVEKSSLSSSETTSNFRGRLASLQYANSQLPQMIGSAVKEETAEQPLIFSDGVLGILEKIDPSFSEVRELGWQNAVAPVTSQEQPSESEITSVSIVSPPLELSDLNEKALPVASEATIFLDGPEFTNDFPVISPKLDKNSAEGNVADKLIADQFEDRYTSDKTTKTASKRVTFDEKLFAQISKINRRINTEIIPQTDEQAYGQKELWTLPLTLKSGRFGDCEDYALEKREALLKAGIPASSLFFAVAHSRATGRHALLILSTDKGDYVLDNMTSEILPWTQTNYTWISRQSAADPLVWSSTYS